MTKLFLILYLYMPLTSTGDTTFTMDLGTYPSIVECSKAKDKLETTINSHVNPLEGSWIGVRGFGCGA